MTVTLKFTPLFKNDGVFTGMGKYVASIEGKLAWIEIFADGDVRFKGWLKSELLSDEEENFFKTHGEKLKTKKE